MNIKNKRMIETRSKYLGNEAMARWASVTHTGVKFSDDKTRLICVIEFETFPERSFYAPLDLEGFKKTVMNEINL